MWDVKLVFVKLWCQETTGQISGYVGRKSIFWVAPVFLVFTSLKVKPISKIKDNTRYLDKAMAPHSSTAAQKIPWMEEPGRLQSMGSSLITWLMIHWLRGWLCTGHVASMHWSHGYHALITWLIIYWSRDWSCINHEADRTIITWLRMHWSRGWSCTDHVFHHALFTWLLIHWSRGWSCTDHFVDNALITWLIIHWSRGWHSLITWLAMHWSPVWSCTDHVADQALIS